MTHRIGAAGLSLVLAVAGLLHGPDRVVGATDQWTTAGPSGGTIMALEINPRNPSLMLAGTLSAGIFRSIDGGRSWHPTTGLPNDGHTFDISYARSDPAIVYAAHQYGASRSDDGGRTWSPIYTASTATAIEADPFNPDHVFLNDSWLYRSTDGGSSWAEVEFPGGNRASNFIAAAPSRPGRFYIAGPDGVHRTDDGGGTWVDNWDDWWPVEALAVDPTNADRLFAATAGEVYRSTDAIKTWEEVSEGLPRDLDYFPHIVSIAIDASHPDVVYASAQRGGRVFRSSDSGELWSEIPTGISSHAVFEIAVDPGDSGRIFLGMQFDGILRSSNGGGTWGRSNQGLIASQIASLLPIPRSALTVLAGTTGQGVFRSTDGGLTWKGSGLRGLDVEALASSPLTPNVVFAATSGFWYGRGGGVYRSRDGGQSWRRTQLHQNELMDVAVASSDPRVVYANSLEGVWRSGDGGNTWKKVSNNGSVSLAVHPRRPQTVYAGSGDGLLRSTDGGGSWKRLLSDELRWAQIWDIAFEPSMPRVILLATDFGIYRSADGGGIWHHEGDAPLYPSRIHSVVFDAAHRGRAYAAGVIEGGVFRSNDFGRTWTDIGHGIPSAHVGNVAVSSTGGRVYAGTSAYNTAIGAGAYVLRYR